MPTLASWLELPIGGKGLPPYGLSVGRHPYADKPKPQRLPKGLGSWPRAVCLDLLIDPAAVFQELLGFFLHSFLDRDCHVLELVGLGIVADVLGDLHRAEMRAAHGAEVGDLVGFVGHGLVVVFPRAFRIQ